MTKPIADSLSIIFKGIAAALLFLAVAGVVGVTGVAVTVSVILSCLSLSSWCVAKALDRWAD